MPKGIYIRTKKETLKHKQRISKALKKYFAFLPKEQHPRYGKGHSEEAKRKIGITSKGRFFSKETRKKMSISQKGRKHSKETKEKISARNKNRLFSEEHKRHISEGQLGIKRKSHSEATKKKMSLAQTGEKNHMWKGGLSKDIKHKRKLARLSTFKYRARKRNNGGILSLKEWEEIKKRYGNMCPACGDSEPNIKLTIDHIVPIVKGGKDIKDNIQPLCQSCNSRKRTKIIAYERNGQLRMVIK